jgi:hypothetical protein
VHKLDIPQSEAGVHASHRVKYGKKKVAKPGNLLKKSYGSIRGMLRPKAGAPDLVHPHLTRNGHNHTFWHRGY